MGGSLPLVACLLAFAGSAAAQRPTVREQRFTETEYTLHLLSYEWAHWTEPVWDFFAGGTRASYGSLTPREFSESTGDPAPPHPRRRVRPALRPCAHRQPGGPTGRPPRAPRLAGATRPVAVPRRRHPRRQALHQRRRRLPPALLWTKALGWNTALLFAWRWLQRGERIEAAGAPLPTLDYESAVHVFDLAARHRLGSIRDRGGVRARLEWEEQRGAGPYVYRRREWFPHVAWSGQPAKGLWLRARWLAAVYDIDRRGDGPVSISGRESKLSLEVEYRFGNGSALKILGSFDTDPSSFGEFDGGALVFVLGL